MGERGRFSGSLPIHSPKDGVLLDFRLLTKGDFNHPKRKAVTQNRPRHTDVGQALPRKSLKLRDSPEPKSAALLFAVFSTTTV